ncbi:hypothetical protein CSAL01_05239 [Colletotrichum salicis]|uniref:Uncharacterized protein n=1 Tax=Colletotrichum salicis TaxID=1209931 RepID=A0A135UM01_9PEZI|nr:hypothetical protein CSAL01_05239 [Colletotrichum salicis]
MAPERNSVNTHIKLLAQWLGKSVNATLYEHAFQKAAQNAKFSVQRIVRQLKQELAPSQAMVRSAVRQEYRQVLGKARNGVNAQRWYEEWQSAYLRAKTYDIPEIDGEIAIIDFLEAVKTRLNPTWGQRTYENLRESMAYGTHIKTLEGIAYAFSLVTQEAQTKKFSGSGGAYSTFAGHSDSSENAINKEGQEVLEAVKSSKWKSIQGELKKVGWLKNDGTPKKPRLPKDSSNQPTTSSSATQDEGHIVAVLVKGQETSSRRQLRRPLTA